MTGVRGFGRVRRWLRISISVAFAVAVASSPGTAEAGGIWRIQDTQIQYEPDYDFRVKEYNVNDELISTQSYTYDGATWIEGYGWQYKWSYDGCWIPAAPGQMHFTVEYRYLGGDWTYFFWGDAAEVDQCP
jgi:hypothetical protein